MTAKLFTQGALAPLLLVLTLLSPTVAARVAAATPYTSFKAYSSRGVGSIAATTDGGYILAGWIYSSDEGSEDAWVLKFDGQGNLVWQKRYGGTSVDIAYSVIPTSDGGYAVAGGTWSLEAVMHFH